MEFTEIERARWIFHRAIYKNMQVKNQHVPVERFEDIIRLRLAGAGHIKIREMCKCTSYTIVRLNRVCFSKELVEAYRIIAKFEGNRLHPSVEYPRYDSDNMLITPLRRRP